MIREKSLAVYKNRPALVTAIGEKITISVLGGESIRVREKDIELIHPGPCTLSELEEPAPPGDVHGAWELLEENSVTLKELAELVYGAYTGQTGWSAYLLLKEGLYFSGDITAVRGRSAEDVKQGEQKRLDRRQEREEREDFLERLKKNALRLPEDGRFLQDVEALGYGKTDKSRTLKDLGRAETPQEAHKLLLSAGFWTPWINPHPWRFGVSLSPPALAVPPPAEEDRIDLSHLASFAIDSPWSNDPDDAISVEGDDLWVHIADPGASVVPGSPLDSEARGRGATLYLPEGVVRMLPEEALSLFALGVRSPSPALSFKITFNDDFSIKETLIARSWVSVTRLTYEETDRLLQGGFPPESPDKAAYIEDLRRLDKAAERNFNRRLSTGGISIDLPDIHITVSKGSVAVQPVAPYRSVDIVRECMLLAGEGAARWALHRRLPFPYISQDAGDLPAEPLGGVAGSYQLRKCMRPRTLSTKPGIHWGLGLDEYTQVTSPLRRYTDLLAHQQIRAFLRNEQPLSEEDMLLRLGTGEAGASAVAQAERASRSHWLAVYLADKKGSLWEGITLEKRGPRTVFMIPALGIETQGAAKQDREPNEPVALTLCSVKIPEAEAVFTAG